jgi:UV DNA damage endonuclease
LRTQLNIQVVHNHSRDLQFLRSDWAFSRNKQSQFSFNMPPKRKRSSVAAASTPSTGPPPIHETLILPPSSSTAVKTPPAKPQASRRGTVDTNPAHNADIMDGKEALRASPDADEAGEALDVKKANGGPPKPPSMTNGMNGALKEEASDSPLSDAPPETPISTPAKKQKKTPTKSSIAGKKGSDEIKAFKAEQAAKKAVETRVKKEDADERDQRVDPDGDEAGPIEDVDVLKREAGRPPPFNSDYLPLPWKGRLGYVGSLSLPPG